MIYEKTLGRFFIKPIQKFLLMVPDITYFFFSFIMGVSKLVESVSRFLVILHWHRK